MGKALGADYFVMGEITIFEYTAKRVQAPVSKQWALDEELRLHVDMRIVNSRTSKVVAAHKGEVKDISRTLHDSNDAPPALEADFVDQLQRKLCDELVVYTIDSVYPIRIVDSDGLEVSLNRGQGGGLEVGMTLDVLVEGKQIKDPDTGELLGYRQRQIGQIRVTEVEERLTHGTVISGEAPFPEGAVCKPVQKEEAKPETPRGPKW